MFQSDRWTVLLCLDSSLLRVSFTVWHVNVSDIMLPCIAILAYSNKGSKQVIRLHRTMSIFVIKVSRQSPGYERQEYLSRKSSCVNYLEASPSYYTNTHVHRFCNSADLSLTWMHIFIGLFSIAKRSKNFLFVYNRPLRKRVLQTVQSNSSSSNLEYPCVSLRSSSSCLNFRHRASCILGQAFRYSPENAFYIFNQQIYFIIWYLLDRASLI